MKGFILLIVVLFASLIAYCQDKQDVVYLKNGKIIKGLITEQIPNEHLKIKTIEGIFYTCKFSDIDKINQEADEINLNEYGGTFSYGISIGGSGLIGIHVRVYPTEKFALEVGAYYRPFISFDNEDTSGGIMFAGGANIFFDKSCNCEKDKVRLNGLLLKAGYSSANIPESFFCWLGARKL